MSFSLEEALLRGQIPLLEFKKILESKNEATVQKLDFSRNGYCNDAVLQIIQSYKKKNYIKISEVILDGCTQITNAGIHCLTQICEGGKYCSKLVLDGCSQLSDDDLSLLLKLPWKNIFMRGTSIRHLSHPDGRLVHIAGCPILTGLESLVDVKYSHVLIVHQKNMPCCSVIDFMQSKKVTTLSTFKHMTDFPLKDWKVTLSEIDLSHPLFDAVISSHPVQVIIPVHSEKGTIDEIKKHVIDTILAVVSKAAFTTDYPKNQVPLMEKDTTTAENEENDTQKGENEKNTTEENEKKTKEESEKKTDEEKPEIIRSFREYEFILVQVGDNPKQLEQLQEIMKEDFFKETIENMDKNIEFHEQHFADLDVIGQCVYSTLCQTKEKLKKFNEKKKERIHYISLDTKSAKGLDQLLDIMTEILNCHKHHQEVRFKIAEKYEKLLDVVMETVKREKIIDLSLGLTEKLSINGNEFHQIAKLLHEQGRIIILQLCSKTILADVKYLTSKYDAIRTAKLGQGMTSHASLAINKDDNIMTMQMATKLLDLKEDYRSTLLMKILHDYCGLIELPTFRLQPTDEHFIYLLLDKLQDPPPFSLDKFCSEDKPSNFVVMEKTYRFIYPITNEILPGLISSAAKYGRILLVTPKGAAFQIGCVQTAVKTCQGISDYGVITIQSKCYFPDYKNEALDEETETNVKEYVWNIFCLYTDLMEKLLKQRNVVYQSSGDIPTGVVHNSFGCKHVWKNIDGKHNQSVCTLCNKCCDLGRKCKYNGIMGDHLRECLCKTLSSGCVDCGICVFCTSELWEVRSYLRPQMISGNLGTRKYPNSHPESVCSLVPLDPIAYNEVECQHLNNGSIGAYLKEVEDGTKISVFPGKARYFSAQDELGEYKLVEKFMPLLQEEEDQQYQLQKGDNIKIRITDPFDVMTKKKSEELDLTVIKESRAVYHAKCREMIISHETGLLCYDTKSASTPVGQFIGPEKFSEKFKKFSFKIINNGKNRTIGIGVAGSSYAHNRMVGWNKESYGYHADDGLIFMESGSGKNGRQKCYKDDIMSVYCDTEEKDIRFYRNDQLVYTIPPDVVNVPRSGLYPIISLHSPGECVKLLEKDVWTPNPGHSLSRGKSFDTYKYGNMWISPTKNVCMTKKQKAEILTGWIILHNPTKGLIGYQMNPGCQSGAPEIGSLAPNESLPFNLQRDSTNDEVEDVVIEWIAIDNIMDYKPDEIKQMFNTAHDNRKYHHRLNLVMEGNTSSSEILPQFTDTENMDCYRLDVLKNSTLIDSYLLKKGRYLIGFLKINSSDDPDFLLKTPKCPSFMYPPVLSRGMKVVCSLTMGNIEDVPVDDGQTAPSNTKLVEAIVNSVSDDGKVDFSFNNDDLNGNDETWCKLVTELEWKNFEAEQKKSHEMLLDLYKADRENDVLQKTYIPAPSYLVSKGGALASQFIDPEWKKSALMLFSSCSQMITRPTVQEQIINVHSRHLHEWIHSKSSTTQLPYCLVYLPSDLDSSKLMFPVAMNMYEDISMHRLCCVYDDQLELFYQSQTEKYPQIKLQYDVDTRQTVTIHDGIVERTYPLKNPQEASLHFMDLPSFPINKDLPVDYSYANMYLAWNYVALLSRKLTLPSYDKIVTEGKEDGNKQQQLPRQQVEQLMFQLMQSYASLCGIYATQHGGLSYQTAPDDLEMWVQDLCGEDVPIKKIDSEMTNDNSAFVSVGNMLACKSHAYCNADFVKIPDFSLDSKFFKPYANFSQSLMIRDQKLNSLPNDLLSTFNSLTVLSIANVDLKDISEFPSGVSKCTNLEVLCLSSLKGIKRLPKDIISGPALSTFFLYNCPVNKLDIDWPVNKGLTSLTLKGLLIQDIPAGLGNLKELLELNLDYNPITTLPKEIESLTKLKHLSVKGIPWIAFEGKYEQMPQSIYKTWHEENPYIVNNLSNKEVDKLFHDCDINSNDILDKMEIARLNLHFLFKIPRLGNQLMADKEFGGVPSVIFKLTSLETLDLSYTAITHLPVLTREILTLETINLEHCPLLESIDGNVGLLPNLRSLHLNSCPSLETPPQDIVGRGFDSVKAFLQKMAGGFTECHRTKLMFIGLGQAGKTTLLKALQSSSKKYTGSIPKLTDGIVINEWMVPVGQDDKEFQIRYSCWDFAGQTVYYNTHQFFLSNQAVYMLLWNMRMGFEHAGLDFWLSSTACHCPNAPVIVVGTQLDQIPMPDIREDELMKKYPQIKRFCYVSSIVGTNIPELQETLIDVTLNHCTQMKMKIPLLWLKLEESIVIARTKHRTNIIDWDKMKEFATEHGLSDERDIKLAVQFLDDLGIVQYFDSEVLHNKVVINPQWIVDVMAKVVSVNEKSIKENKGRFYHKFIPTIWKSYDSSLHEWMLKLTEAFDLTFPIPEDGEEKINIVPCLLPEKEPKNLPWPYLTDEEGMRESKIQYKFTYLPTGLFNRAQARLFSQGFMINEEFLELMWKRGSILKKNDHYALVKQTSDYEMVVTVQGARPKNILDLIHETISALIKDSFQGVAYDFYIPCPDCLEKKGTRDPFLFKAELISRAHNVNAPFLQCTKYFHTVSIGELMNILPDNKETEFDVQMQQSISTLQEISSNMAKDVAILYSPEDLPAKNQKGKMVDPRQIYKDLKKAGFRCWMPEDNTPDVEMTMEIKNSKKCYPHSVNCIRCGRNRIKYLFDVQSSRHLYLKVLVVCMSEKFVRHPRCRQMFLYASEQLKKSFAIAVIDEKLDFQQTDLGFKIGIPKMAMIKNVERYSKKIFDLIDIVKDYIADAEKAVVNHPPVFISYCWSNSKEACSVTTQAKEGSLGFGDPRVIKKHLEKNGIKCWLDIEQMGKYGLYQDITVGLQNAKVLVICVSDEYLQSDACMMESRFGAYNLQMPMVVCVVGTGKAWKMSEVSLMISKQGDLATVVKMQKQERGLYDQVLEHVRKFLACPETEKQRKIREKLAKLQAKEEQLKKEDLEKQLIQQGDTRFSFQEETELIQRKFLRHITKMTRLDDMANALPKLLVFDFVSAATTVTQPINDVMGSQASITSEFSSVQTSSFRSSLGKIKRLKRRKSRGKLQRDEEDNVWKEQEFCIRTLCEDEQGWHLEGNPLSLINFGKEEIFKALKDMSPYLTRIYAILKQSGISLNCMNSSVGEHFINYVRKEGIGIKNFAESYKTIQRMVAEHEDQEEFVNQLNRCHHQIGKISWLCSVHQNKAGMTLLPAGTVSIHGSGHLQLFEEDILLSEYLQDSKAFLAWKGEGSLHTRKSSQINQEKLKEAKIEKKKEDTQKIEEKSDEKSINLKTGAGKQTSDVEITKIIEEQNQTEKNDTLNTEAEKPKPDVEKSEPVRTSASTNVSKTEVKEKEDELLKKDERRTDSDIHQSPKPTTQTPVADKTNSTRQAPKPDNSTRQMPKPDVKQSGTCCTM